MTQMIKIPESILLHCLIVVLAITTPLSAQLATLPPMYTELVEISVVTGKGNPLEDATVLPNRPHTRQYTNAKGKTVFLWHSTYGRHFDVRRRAYMGKSITLHNPTLRPQFGVPIQRETVVMKHNGNITRSYNPHQNVQKHDGFILLHLLDEETKRPLENVRIIPGNDPAQAVKSNQFGAALINGPIGEGKLTFSLDGFKFIDTTMAYMPLEGRNEFPTDTVSLVPDSVAHRWYGGLLSIKVMTYNSGELPDGIRTYDTRIPLEGVRVTLLARDEVKSTDSTGRVLFEGLSDTTYRFRLEGDQLLSQYLLCAVSKTDRVQGVVTRMAPVGPMKHEGEGGIIYGQVVDKETGKPVQGVVVTVGREKVRTDQDGWYLFQWLSPGKHTLVFENSEYRTHWADPVILQAGEAAKGSVYRVDAELVSSSIPGDNVIRGKLINELFDVPLAGWTVKADGFATVLSDNKGDFEIPCLPNGTFQLSFIEPARISEKRGERTITFDETSEGPDTVNVNFRYSGNSPGEAAGWLYGTIRAEGRKGLPVEGATLKLYPSGHAGTSDAMGRYQVPLPYGENRLIVQAPGYKTNEDTLVLWPDWQDTIQVLEYPVQLEKANRKPAGADVRLSIFDKVTGEPLPGALVCIPGSKKEALSGGDGSVQFADLKAELIKLQIVRLGYEGFEQELLLEPGSNQREILLYPNRITNFPTRLLYLHHTEAPRKLVRGRVVDEELSSPLSLVEIRFIATSNAYPDTFTTLSGPGGRFMIEVPEGLYVVMVDRAGIKHNTTAYAAGKDSREFIIRAQRSTFDPPDEEVNPLTRVRIEARDLFTHDLVTSGELVEGYVRDGYGEGRGNYDPGRKVMFDSLGVALLDSISPASEKWVGVICEGYYPFVTQVPHSYEGGEISLSVLLAPRDLRSPPFLCEGDVDGLPARMMMYCGLSFGYWGKAQFDMAFPPQPDMEANSAVGLVDGVPNRIRSWPMSAASGRFKSELPGLRCTSRWTVVRSTAGMEELKLIHFSATGKGFISTAATVATNTVQGKKDSEPGSTQPSEADITDHSPAALDDTSGHVEDSVLFGRVEGKVRYRSEDKTLSLPYAEIVIQREKSSDSYALWRLQTDDLGRFALDGLPAGDYSWRPFHPSVGTSERWLPFSIVGNDTVHLEQQYYFRHTYNRFAIRLSDIKDGIAASSWLKEADPSSIKSVKTGDLSLILEGEAAIRAERRYSLALDNKSDPVYCDSRGIFRFRGVPIGNHRIVVQGPLAPYSVMPESVEVIPGIEASAAIRIQSIPSEKAVEKRRLQALGKRREADQVPHLPTGALILQLTCNSDDFDLGGIRVTIDRTGDNALTLEDGTVSLFGLPPGSHTLTVSSERLNVPSQHLVVVKAGGVVRESVYFRVPLPQDEPIYKGDGRIHLDGE